MVGPERAADGKARIAVRVVAQALRIPGAHERPLEVLLPILRERSPAAFEALVEYAEASTSSAIARSLGGPASLSSLEVARASAREEVARAAIIRFTSGSSR